jgi:hypothetical protein
VFEVGLHGFETDGELAGEFLREVALAIFAEGRDLRRRGAEAEAL